MEKNSPNERVVPDVSRCVTLHAHATSPLLRLWNPALNSATIARLNSINRRFYDERADEFDQTRERAWRGWDELFDRYESHLRPSPKVLDLGCGNGRFARFLARRRNEPFAYFGVDASALGIEHARRRIGELPGVRLSEHDFIIEAKPLPAFLDAERFDLIVAFGVVHHVPGSERRRSLLTALSQRLAAGGILTYTVWRFDRFDRFTRKLVPWEEFLAQAPDLNREELEPGDHIMTWGAEPAFRYCHAMSDEEAEELERALPLAALPSFLGDDELNTYHVLIQPPSPDWRTGHPDASTTASASRRCR